jgi:predicted ATPase/DNA-binding SARP family transcriptional activator/Tfp pilus assembly protein PilF
MTSLTLTLLGGFQAVVNGHTLQFPTDKIRALLAYLAIEQGRPHRREALAALLWPDLPDKQARSNLRLSLHRLRQTLDKASPDLSTTLLAITPTTVQWQSDAAQVDYVQLGATMTAVAAHDHAHPESCPVCLPQLETAAALLQGELLAGFSVADSLPFEEWLLVQREYVHQQGLRLFSLLATAQMERAAYDAAYAYAQRQLALEPWYEAAHRQAMQALAWQGEPERALAQFASCRDILWQELGVEPASETAVLAQQIRDGDLSARPATAPLRHFPAFLTPFVGRQAELEEIVARLQQPYGRLLTLVGPGGTGKSRLAMQAAHHLAAQAPNLEGVCFVPLAAVNETPLVLTAVAAALDLHLEPENPRAQLLAALEPRRLLLLLDNLEHLPGAAALVAEMLAVAPGLRLLATSREPLRLQGEQLLPVGGLAYPVDPDEADPSKAGPDLSDPDLSDPDLSGPLRYDAVKLFVQSARQMAPNFQLTDADLTAVYRLCRLLDGLPLALELAAAWTRLMDCPAILRETERSLTFLAAPWRDAPARHQSLQAVFQQTWVMLPPHQQQSWAQMAAFPADFSLPALQAIMPTVTMLDVAALLDRSLLRRAEGGRYELHPLLKQFAASQASPDAQWRVAFSRHYLQEAARLEKAFRSPALQTALEQLRRDLPNLRRAWLWGVRNGLWDELGRSLPALTRFYQLSGLFAEAVAGVETTLAQLPELAETAVLRGQLHLQSSHFLGQQGAYAAAISQAEIALSLGERLGDKGLLAQARAKIGEWLRHQGRFVEAEEWLMKALAVAEEALLAAIHNEIGFTCLGRGQYAAARQAFQTALALSQEEGDAIGTAVTLGNLGYVNQLQGDYAAARDDLQQALSLAETLGDRQGIVKHTLGLGKVDQEQGQSEAARSQYRAARRQAEAIGYLRGALTARVRLADTDLLQNRLDAAEQGYQRALPLLEKARLRDLVAHVTGNLGIIQARRGAFEAAIRQYQAAVALCREISDPVSASRHLGNLGVAHRRLGEHEASQAAFLEVLPIARAAGARDREAGALLNLGAVSQRLERLALAQSYFDQALAIFTDLNNRDGRAKAIGFLGILHQEKGELAAAAEHFRQALALSQEMGDALNSAVWRLNLADVHLDQGEWAAAGPHLQASLDCFCRLNSQQYLAEALLQEARWLLAQDGREAAHLALAEAIALAEMVGDKALLAKARGLLLVDG